MSQPRPGYLLSPKATVLALSGVLLGMLLAALNQTIVATALPRITEDLGGLAHYSWVFFVALPVGVVALVVVLSTLRIPPHPDRAGSIDYTGAGLLAAGVSCVLLGTVRAGEQAPGGSSEVIALFAVGLAVLAVLAWHERRAESPIVPVSLFRLRTFSAAAAASFAVGVGMFGAIMFVPLFVQGVLGQSATNAGLVLTPLMLGLVSASVGSGQLIARTGRYRWAIVSGPVVMGAGFALLGALDTHSSRGSATIAMVVLGIGLGLVLQNLLLVVQNSVPSRELGIATSATQFFRTTGGTIGVSVMGALMTSGLPADAESASPHQLADAIHPVFMLGIPLMVVALALVLLIPEQPLRRHVREPEATPVAA